MSEKLIPKIEKSDIKTPALKSGESAIVFQRHERYNRDRTAEDAGSLLSVDAESARQRDEVFFKELLSRDTDSSETMVLFVSSDTQYADKGYRSMETAQIAQDAATKVMLDMGIDPAERILNLNPNFATDSFEATGQNIRPDTKIREPQIFDHPEYVDHLRTKYGKEDGAGAGMSPAAWGAHEMDAEKEMRESIGAESVYEMLDRTKKSIAIMERYAKIFHANNPDKKLVIWAASHYDTISPLVKDATGTEFEEYVPVDYGAGVVIELGKNVEPLLSAQNKKIPLQLGGRVLRG